MRRQLRHRNRILDSVCLTGLRLRQVSAVGLGYADEYYLRAHFAAIHLYQSSLALVGQVPGKRCKVRLLGRFYVHSGKSCWLADGR